MIEFSPLWLTLKLAFFTTVILFIVSIPLANWLSSKRSIFKIIAEVLVSMPLVLPPSVIGFYMLLAFSPGNAFGKWLEEWFDLRLVFSFEGLLIASVIYSLPFMVNPLQSGFESLNKNMLEASYISGKGKFKTLLFIALPNIKPALITAIIITFSHTVGEFGVVLMIGGSIPGETKVASVAIYEFVEIMDYTNAHIYSAIMITLSFLTLLGVYIFNGKQKNMLLGKK